MRLTTILAISLFLVGVAPAQHQHTQSTLLPVEMYTGLGSTHHPVSTASADAQKHFDRGLALLYGFNHEEAVKEFQRAAEIDPGLAMAYWGIALVSGENYNAPEFPEFLKIARENLKKAEVLAPKVPQEEQAYIAALAKRYDDAVPDPAQREIAYSAAMRTVHERYPDDLDAATLYAESLMNQRPWALWSKDGTPAPQTEQIIAILESVLRRNPQHIGANHYYIHAVEGSRHPERALASADRLRDLKLSAGHLVHMPAHIYFRTGDYVQAADVNVAAANVDRRYLGGSVSQPGLYSMMYYSHNLHFLALADCMAGRYEQAMWVAQTLHDHVLPALKEMPMLESFLPVRTYVLARFGKWDEVLRLPEPEQSLHLDHGVWQWARGMALAAKGDRLGAQREYDLLHAARQKIAPSEMVDKNSVSAVLQLAELMLSARIAQARNDLLAAQRDYETAAKVHDGFNYTEPPEWPFPVRESLGAMLLAHGHPAEAEKAFREDLDHFPRNGRSLYGLAESLKAQNSQPAAQFVAIEFRDAWKSADIPLRVDELELGSLQKSNDIAVPDDQKKPIVNAETH